jgi:hypothetical protein
VSHLKHEEISAHLDGALEGAARGRVERHLADCPACRAALAELAAQDAALRPALEHDPGEAYFESFAARVEDRIRAAGLKGAQSRLGGGGLFAWLRSPHRVAWAGAVATVVVGAGIVMLTTRQERPLLENPQLIERSEPGPATAPPPAARSKETARKLDGITGNERAPAQALTKSAPAKLLDRENAIAAGGAKDKKALGLEQRAQASATEEASPQAAPAREGAPMRAQEVRRAPSGEDVPVRSDEMKFAEPPSASRSEGDLTLTKPRAQPMETQGKRASSTANEKLGMVGTGTRFCGRVVDAQGRAVAGAAVALVNEGRTATADADGKFCMPAPVGLHELTAMAVGYEPARMQVRVEGETTDALVTLRAVSVLDQRFRSLLGSSRDKGEPAADPFAASPEPVRALAREAERLSADAAAAESAAAFERAAVAWARVAGVTKNAPWLEARYRSAEARYRAWLMEPTAARKRVARDAIDAFLVSAPAGPRRNQAVGWRQQVRP